MKKTNLDYIKTLSLMDKKDILGKTMKVSEECGELNGKVLPLMNAHGTRHRFVDKEAVLEEVSDTILAALSVAYDLGFDHDDIEDMMMLKSKKWATLQQAEARMTEQLPFEIHVTIKEADQEKFINTCRQLEVKPIILALQSKDKLIKDVMTSSQIIGNNKVALEEMKRISNGLSASGFSVLREKIETVPWHTAAPSREFNRFEMPKDCYFECHFGIKMDDDESKLSILKDACINFDCHLSKNFFKKNEDGSYTIMATYRKYEGVSEDFILDAEKIKYEFEKLGFVVDKLITEFSIYDTRVSHDSEWLSKH